MAKLHLAAFLRGINLGNRRLTMDELRSHFEGLGYPGVATFLASGNVVFEAPGEEGSPGTETASGTEALVGEEGSSGKKGRRARTDELGALETAIEGHLERSLGYPVDTFVRTLDALTELVDLESLAGADAAGFKPQVVFLKKPLPHEAEAALATLEGPDDRFLAQLAQGREVVWLRRGGLSDAPFPLKALQKALGVETWTIRTLNTVRRMVRRFGA